MRTHFFKSAIWIVSCFFSVWGQGVTIGSNNAPHGSAVLDVQSSSQGFLPPRLTTTQRNAISSPASGLLIYNTTTQCLEMFVPSGAWNQISCNCIAFPNANFTFSPGTVSLNSPITFNPSAVSGVAYAWTFSNGVPATSSAANPAVTWSGTGTQTITLTVTDLVTGCSANSTQNVNVVNCLPGSQTINYSGNEVTFTVPSCVTSLTIEARGAQGGNASSYSGSNGGNGARMIGTFAVTGGEVLRIRVGQMGGTTNSNVSAGGGGGTYVVRQSNGQPLIVAGGGGGGGHDNGNPGGAAPITNNGGTLGGNSSPGNAGGGGGFTGNGLNGTTNGGQSFSNGSQGGANTGYNNQGGYGGGGAGWSQGGGGGGYNGGNGGPSGNLGGFGGGSFNAGTNPQNTAGFQTGNGQVIITW